ncbi:FGGY-family carbohydrate kinase [Caldisericum exile]|uniref:Carbohydrate kinase, FGGY family n=1 Tax=Caldisericum exile (strain DSM 21853 / NBRC 104410 / AZM16c01) TaxID=511051 RepID=A0A7U6GFL9_CALEA|nr:FGGY family carbohydrate kinase [Caldisericum exile]BAL81504.1 carbohydrate kinase, FGGY family [Caldisericum exile AZM16c01]
MRDLALGIDLGTTALKAIVIDSSGKIYFEKSISQNLISTAPNFAEMDADAFFENTLRILSEVYKMGLDKRIASIGITGMVPTLIPVDENLKPLRYSIQQNDARAVEEIEYFKTAIDEDWYFNKTGNTINQQVIFPKWLWLKKHEPDVISKTKYIMGSYDFVSTKLTGNPHVELNWALESGLFNIKENKFDEEILSKVEIVKSILPQVVNPKEVVGYVSKEIEALTGFNSGVPVIGGSADHIASTLGVGLINEGDLLLKFGGAGDIMFVSDSLRIDKRLFIDFHDVEGKYVLNGCMASSGSVIKWYMNVIGENDFDKITDEAYKSSIGANGIIILPYFLGEKTPIFDAKARGVIFGLQLFHGRGDIFRSILESIVYGFMHHIDVLNEIGLDVKRVFISDGGAKNPLLRQITSDAIGLPLKYVKTNPGSSLGVAFLALLSVGLVKDVSAVETFVKDYETIEPNTSNTSLYREYFGLYKDLYKAVKPLYERLYKIQNKGG